MKVKKIKKIWFVADVKYEDGTMFAQVIESSEHLNVKYVLGDIAEKSVFISARTCKKDAFSQMDAWNKAHKENGDLHDFTK